MAREIVIGIVIRGKDAAGPALDQAGKGSKRLGDEVEKAAAKTKEAARSGVKFGDVARGLNATLQIAEKAWRAFSAAIGGVIATSLQSRSIFDANARTLFDLQRSVTSLQRSIGDVLVPILAGFAEAFTPLLKAGQRWIDQHREMVGGKLVGWLSTVARVTVGAVSSAAIGAAQAWAGFNIGLVNVWNTGSKLIRTFLSGLEKLESGHARVLRAFNFDKEAAGHEAAARKLIQLQAEFAGSAEVVRDETNESMKALAEQEAMIRKVEQSIKSAIAQGAVNATKAFGKEVSRTSGLTEFYVQDLIRSTMASIEFSNSQAEITEKLTRLAHAITTTDEEARAMTPTLFKMFGAMRADNFLREGGKLTRGMENTGDSFQVAAEDLKKFDEKLQSMSGFEALVGVLKLVSKGTLTAKEGFSTLLDYAKENAQSIARSISGPLFGAFESIIEGTKTASEAFGEMGKAILKTIAETLLQMVIAWGIEQAIMAAKKALGIETAATVAAATISGKAVETGAAATAAAAQVGTAKAVGAANAISAHAGIPFVGIAIGIAAAAAIIAAIVAATAGNGFAHGGVVGGGFDTGRDSVMIRARPGEGIITPETTQALVRDLSGGRSSGAASSGGGGGGLNVTLVSAFPQSRAEIQRFERDSVSPGLARLRRRV